MDYDMPDQFGHYLALLGAVARLAGTDAAGGLPNDLTADMERLSVGERAPLTVDRLERRVDRLADFAAYCTYLQTCPESWFVTTTVCHRFTP